MGEYNEHGPTMQEITATVNTPGGRTFASESTQLRAERKTTSFADTTWQAKIFDAFELENSICQLLIRPGKRVCTT